MNYSYDIMDMRDIACKEFIQSNDPSGIALSILCGYKKRNKLKVIIEKKKFSKPQKAQKKDAGQRVD